MAMHGDDPAYDRIPDDRELIAQYLLFYEMSLPFGQDLGMDVDIARSSLLVTAYLAGVSSAEVRDIGLRGEDWLKKHAPEMATQATGLSMVYAHLSERNVRSMISGTIYSLVLISGIMLVAMRSLFIGLISLVPNLIPAAIAFGLWGYLWGEVNLAVSVVGSMTYGIVVDDTVHILTRYRQFRRDHGLSPAEAVRETKLQVGTALIVTTVALILGFGVLAISGFAVSSLMGILSAIIIFIALVADLTLLPALLIALDKTRR
jgi:predicted RND superfamily exporter protein